MDYLSSFLKRVWCRVLEPWKGNFLFIIEIGTRHAFSVKHELSLVEVFFAITNDFIFHIRLKLYRYAFINKRSCLNGAKILKVYFFLGHF